MRASRSVARSPFRQLRSTCEFWVDQRQHVACCQFADEEQLETEAESFDCESCQVTAHLAGLDADNRRAWDLAHLVWSRFLVDAHGVMPAIDRLTPDLDDADFADLLRRLNVIYDVLAPPAGSVTRE